MKCYIDAFQEVRDLFLQTNPGFEPASEIAVLLMNTSLFLKFLNSYVQNSYKIPGVLGLLPGLMDPRSLEHYSEEVIGRATQIIDDHFGKKEFCLDTFETGKSSEIIIPDFLDDANEAISRFLEGNDKKASHGVFYTSRGEIDFMCKCAVYEFLRARNPGISIRDITAIVFEPEPDRSKFSLNLGSNTALKALQDSMNALSVLDPACGSGAFLIGMAELCNTILKRFGMRVDGTIDGYRFISKYITKILHGVDIDKRAIQVAKIRLWLWLLKESGKVKGFLFPGDLPNFENNFFYADFLTMGSNEPAGTYLVIIGNPPYIRQEDIKPPSERSSPATREEKKVYRDSVIRLLKAGVPSLKKISEMSDYYIYFFFKGLQSLQDNGILCFITSNSWLDAGFGKDLQEFLLKHSHLIAIHDFETRSFEKAEINTVITVCRRLPRNDLEGGRKDQPDEMRETKFIHFKQPVNHIDNTLTISQIDGLHAQARGSRFESLAKNIEITPSFQAFSIAQADLFSDGLVNEREFGEEISTPAMSGAYSGNKWRGKFLNANEILYTTLKKGTGALVELGSLAIVKAGCYSGINEFFYLTSERIREFGIEADFCKPIIRRSDDIPRLHMKDLKELKDNYVLAIPPLSKDELKRQGSRGLLSYIEWGETQRTKRGQKRSAGVPWPLVESVKPRAYWYSIPEKSLVGANLFMQYIAHDRFYCPWSEFPVLSDRCFHRLFPLEGVDPRALFATLNSTLQAFFVMVLGRSGLGGGALKHETSDARKMLTVDVRKLSPSILQELKEKSIPLGKRQPNSLLFECGYSQERPGYIQEPNPVQDRKDLDNVVFDVLDLDARERREIYSATCVAIKYRLKKARTFIYTS